MWRKPERTFVEYGCSRFLRIYLPFLAWSAVYLGFKAAKSRLLPDQPNDFPGIEILWTGSFYHLWFMPFILLVSLAAFLVAKFVHGRESLRWPVAIVSLAAGFALSVPSVAAAITPNGDPHPVDYMIDALPAMFLAMTAALAYGCKRGQPWPNFYRFRFDVLLFVGSMIWPRGIRPIAADGESGRSEPVADRAASDRFRPAMPRGAIPRVGLRNLLFSHVADQSIRGPRQPAGLFRQAGSWIAPSLWSRRSPPR